MSTTGQKNRPFFGGFSLLGRFVPEPVGIALTRTLFDRFRIYSGKRLGHIGLCFCVVHGLTIHKDVLVVNRYGRNIFA